MRCQFRLIDEGSYFLDVPGGAIQMYFCFTMSVMNIVGAEVGHAVIFDVFPDELNRVAVRSVWREAFEVKPVGFTQQASDRLAAMHIPVVPDHDDLSTRVSKKQLKKVGRLFVVDVLPGKSLEVKAHAPEFGRHAHGGDHRDFLSMPAASLHDWGTAPGRQGTTHQRRK